MKEKQLLKTIVEGIQEKKGKKITTVDLSKIESAATSHFIICEGQSTTQVMAIKSYYEDTRFTKYRNKTFRI